MAEYCENCAKEFGFEAEYDAIPCEGCGKTLYKEEKEWIKVVRLLGIVLIISLFTWVLGLILS